MHGGGDKEEPNSLIATVLHLQTALVGWRRLYTWFRRLIVFIIITYYFTLQEVRVQQVTNHAYRSMNNLSELFGIVGPNGPAAAEFWAPIFQHSHLLTVSYY